MEQTKQQTVRLSSVFEDGGSIPSRYTCEGENINPPLALEDLPEETACLALIMEDPDAPDGTFIHWLVWNIPPGDISEYSNPGISGVNSAGKTGYHGPCPPDGSHRYFFHVYALSQAIDLPGHATREELEEAIAPLTIGRGMIMGTYEKSNQ